MFEFKVDHPDKENHEGEQITLVFKDYGDVPGRVSRRNIGRIEAQIWASLEWGLVEPSNWPLNSDKVGNNIFDELPQRLITEIYREWQKASD